MQMRKTQYGWMALGGLLCLFGVILVCKWRDSGRAVAQAETRPADVPVVPLPSEGEAWQKVPDSTPAPEQAKEVMVPIAVRDTEVPASPPMATPPAPRVSGPSPEPTLEPLPPSPGAPLPPVGSTPKEPQGLPPLAAPAAAVRPPADPPAPTPTPAVTTPLVVPVTLREPSPPPAPVTPGTTVLPSGTPLPSVSVPGTPVAPGTGLAPPAFAPPTPTPPVTAPSGPPPAVAPTQPVGFSKEEAKVVRPDPAPGEPPLAPAPGPVQAYQVRAATETLPEIARRTLGDSARWTDIHKLNPTLKPDAILVSGTIIRLPSDACIPSEEIEAVKPLPGLRPDTGAGRPKVVLPLTGTYPCNLDGSRLLVLPRAIREQLGGGDTILVSPGPDHCLWLTNQTHLERLAKRLEATSMHEHLVRDFRRLYFAQTEKVSVGTEGKLVVPERLAQFADLHQEVVLVGIDDHFELWDVARWKQFTQQKSATSRASMTDD